MYRFWIAAVAAATAIVSAQVASAADMPVKAPVAPQLQPPSWAGFYIGVTGGYGWKRDKFPHFEDLGGAPIAPLVVDGVNSRGGVYGGYVGYNWQYGRVVPGIEIDFTATDISGTSSNGSSTFVDDGENQGTITVTKSLSERVKYLGSARARLGSTPLDNLMVYGTAGLAWERVDVTETIALTIQSTGGGGTQAQWSQTAADKFGWVAGLGAEVMLGSPNWIARVEYLHYGMGWLQDQSSSQVAGNQNIDIIRGGLAYKFNGQPDKTIGDTKGPLPSSSTWAGFYIGAHGGYGWGKNPFSIPLFPTDAAASADSMRGWIAGAQIGYNWQYDRIVTGLEFDLSAANVKGGSTIATVTPDPGVTVSQSFENRVKYLGTLRGRLGWLPLDNVLLYGTAGLAWERHELIQNETSSEGIDSAVFRGVSPSDHFGWAAGAGVEVMLGSPNWIGRLEYLHYDFGRWMPQASFVLSGSGTSLSLTETAGRQTIDAVRAGLSYKFGPQMAATTGGPLYTKAPPMLEPALQNWAGFYIGAHGGYGWKENNFVIAFDVVPMQGIDSNGFVAGGQVGYNWQYNRVVAGIELDGSATGIKGTSAPGVSQFATEIWSDNVKYLGTVRGRLGWTPISNVLLYGTGGLAWERVHRTEIQTDVGSGETTVSEGPRDHFGWAAGAGVEVMLGRSNWIGRLEYLHYDFGQVEFSSTVTSTAPGESSADNGGRQTINVVRAGLSYKFTP